MNIRELNEKIEEKTFSKYATLSKNSRGREKYEQKCDIRTEFQRDRDRIIHSKSFRRLKDKTQVFISPEGDHYRTRLTHTLEVSQIARTIAKSLFLNEDLTEAIALGHDLGHTPFGHAGENVLNKICPYGFSHEEQGVRVVDLLEKPNGLNLTYEVKDGILNHSFSCKDLPFTLEGQIVRYADKIAYVNHDIDDVIRAGIIKEKNLPKECVDILGDGYSKRVDTMIKAVIYSSINKTIIDMEESVKDALMTLRSYLFKNVYLNKESKYQELKVENVITSLYEYFKLNPNRLPLDIQKDLEKYDIDRVVCDYIAGMTDHYVLRVYQDVFVPKCWK